MGAEKLKRDKLKRLLRRKAPSGENELIAPSHRRIETNAKTMSNEDKSGFNQAGSDDSRRSRWHVDNKSDRSRKHRRLRHIRGGVHTSQSSTESVDCSKKEPSKHNIISEIVRGTGTFILRQFISTLGSETEANLNRSWIPGGTTLRQAATWTYELRQGSEEQQMEEMRTVLHGRLYRHGNRLQGGAWTRLLFGEEFTAIPSRKQRHELHVILPYCMCINCRLASAKGEQSLEDMDAMLEYAEQGNGFEDDGESSREATEDTRDRMKKKKSKEAREQMDSARKRASLGKLPLPNELGLFGEILDNHEFELGTVSKINSRGAKVQFNASARQFFGGNQYCSAMSMEAIADVVRAKARDHYRKHKGKTERRFYVYGKLSKFTLEGSFGALLFPTYREKKDEINPVGVLFRRQLMLVFDGVLALEDCFGNVLKTEQCFYIGFGQDAEGAQSILSNGKLGHARHLGINELRMHVDVGLGNEVEIRME